MVQIFTALLLGLLTILDPCTLVTSITAISYIDKEINNKRKVLGNGAMCSNASHSATVCFSAFASRSANLRLSDDSE